nr:uncharacterized protein CI109_002800 [Kwoniella shandongensis]KAA5528646.1 hypothetical protein CI109_002800 [Kwoniella shandongensis]
MSTIQLTTTKEVRLYEFLMRKGITKENARNALEEFVFKSMGQGKRVREWCEDITKVLEKISAPTCNRHALHLPPLDILLPFIHLPSNPYFPTAQPPLPAPLVSTASLSSLSRHQFVDALARLSRDDRTGSSPYIDDEDLVIELCLEYIGRRWRVASSDGNESGEDSLVDGISRKLTEIEFELQLQGNTSATLSILHKVRFNLGFVTCAQLITKLNNGFTNTNTHTGADYTNTNGRVQLLPPYGFIKAWAERRLCAGMAYQVVVDDLKGVRSRVEEDTHKKVIIDVLADIGIVTRSQRDERSETPDQFGLHLSPSPIITSSVGSKRTRTLSALFQSQKMGRKTNVHGAPSSKWFPQNRSSSSTTKVYPDDPPNDGPTLPIMSSTSPTVPQSPTLVGTPLSATFPDYITNRSSFSTIRLVTTLHDDVFSSLMAFTDPEDIRAVLLNHLMEMRYHLHGQEDEGWYLGGGKEQAEDLLDHLERKMVGKRDVMGLREVFDSMRSAFDLPPLSRHVIGRLSAHQTSPTSPQSVGRQRGVSVDLDQYLAEIAPTTTRSIDIKLTNPQRQEVLSSPNRESAGAQSTITSESFTSTDSQGRSISRFSDFTIREAKIEYPQESRAVEYHFPPKSTALNNDEDISPFTVAYKKGFSLSVPDLSEGGTYTRLPPKLSLRRSKLRLSKSKSATKLSTSGSDRDFALPPVDEVATPRAAKFDNNLDATPSCIRETLCTLSSSSSLCSPGEHLLVTPDSRRSSTPVDKHRRQWNRNFAIFDGEQVSPSKEYLPLQRGSEKDEHVPSGSLGLSVFEGSPARVRFTPSPSRSCSPGEEAPDSGSLGYGGDENGDEASIPLGVIMKLFSRPQADGLTSEEVERVLERMVLVEKRRVERSGLAWDTATKSHIVWLIEQVAVLLDCPAFVPAISRVVASLSNLSVQTATRSSLSPKYVGSTPNLSSNPNALAPRPICAYGDEHIDGSTTPLNLYQRRIQTNGSISSFDSISSRSTYSIQSTHTSSPGPMKRMGSYTNANTKNASRLRDVETSSIGTFGRRNSIEEIVLGN